MTLINYGLILGFALVAIGFFSRQRQWGKQMIYAGVIVIVVSLLAGSWSDIKSGYMDAVGS
jgi:hypothetical protein